jgi:hypothetical protein
MHANDPQRFIVRMEVYAAVGVLDLDKDGESDPSSDLKTVLAQLASADPDEMEDQTYRQLRFDLCDACRRGLLTHPLGACSD